MSKMETVVAEDRSKPVFSAVVIAASLGGCDALRVVLRDLPAGFPVPLLIAYHNGNATMAALLRKESPLPVGLAEVGMPVPVRNAVVVPDGMQVGHLPSGEVGFVNGAGTGDHADRLFTTMSSLSALPLIAAVLTGSLDDGARGVRAVKRRRGRVLVQDPAEARAPGMPRAALATGCVDFVLPLERMASALRALTMAPGAAELLMVPTPAWATYSWTDLPEERGA